MKRTYSHMLSCLVHTTWAHTFLDLSTNSPDTTLFFVILDTHTHRLSFFMIHSVLDTREFRISAPAL